MIILKSVELNNFLSHDTTRLEFNEGDKVLLDGVSGAGKSSVIDAIIWCLYGVGRVDNRSLVRAGFEKATVYLNLQDGEHEYQVIRSVTIKGKHSIQVVEVTPEGVKPVDTAGTRETQGWIEDKLLRCSYELFINSVAYPQGNRESFVNATSGRRKELLLEILNTEDIGGHLTRVKEIISELDGDIAVVGATVEVNGQRHTENVKLLEEEKQYKERAKELSTYISSMEQNELEAREDFKQLEQQKDKIAKATDAKKRLEQEVKRAEQIHNGPLADIDDKDYANIPTFISEALSSITDKYEVAEKINAGQDWRNQRNALLAERPSIRDYDSEIEDVEKQLKKLVDEQPECPAGNECPYMAQHQPQIDYVTKRRDDLMEKRFNQSMKLKEWQAEIDALGEEPNLTELDKRYAEILRIDRQIDKWNGQLSHVAALASIEQNIDELIHEVSILDQEDAPSEETIANAIESIERIIGLLTEAQDEETQVKGRLEFLKHVKENDKLVIAEMKKATKEVFELSAKKDMFVELKEAFGPNGIQAVALDYLLPALEDRINGVLSQLSDFRVRLDTQREGTSKKVEGLFITIRNDQGEEFSYDSYSGGEKLKITVAISEALATLQNIGFRILDELFVGLDDDSTESFAHVLTQIQGRFSQMLCISHLRQIKDLFDKVVVVNKTNGVSSCDMV